MTPQQQWANHLARTGFRLFPCYPDAKKPACDGGVNAATSEPAGIAAHWEDHPDHNIGLACGEVIVIDCDKPKEGWSWPSDWSEVATPWWDGADVFCDLIEQAGYSPTDAELLSTMVVTTPSGGLHFYYQAPHGMTVRNSAGALAPLVDVRAMGGYVVAPGSVVNGRTYEPLDPAAVPAPMPRWLVCALQAITTRRHTHEARSRVVDTAPPSSGAYTYADRALEDMALAVEGERHEVFVSRIFRLALDESKGLVDLEVLEPRIRDIGRAQGRTEREITAAIRSGRDKATGRS